MKDGQQSGNADQDVTARVKSILGDDGYARVFEPIERPSGLPNPAYWSEDWLALEHERIFARSWVFVGAVDELSETGSIKPAQVAGRSIVLVRDEGGEVRAFHNFCRHRGTRLVMEPCVARTITCPYHAWVYRLNGQIKSRPHFHGAGKLETFEEGDESLNLLSLRCDVWNGCIFVNLDGQAEPLLDWLSPMLNRLQQFDFSPIRWIGKKSYRIKSNWKLVLENYMEGYHVFAAHPRLIAHAPMDIRWSGEWMEHVFYNDYVVPELTKGRGDGLPQYPNLSEFEQRRGAWFACMPNFAVELYADQFVVLATWPIGPGETMEELHFFVIGDEAAEDPKYAEAREELINMWHELNLEDVELLERLQQGRLSPEFEGNVMSPAWEVPAHELAQQIVNTIMRD